jgi:hypothetical protein
MTMNTTTTKATDPNRLLDLIIEKMQLKNDAALARAFGVTPAVISKTRSFVVPFGPTMMLRAHDLAGLTLDEIRRHLNMAPYQRADRAAV